LLSAASTSSGTVSATALKVKLPLIQFVAVKVTMGVPVTPARDEPYFMQ
jgi:hypothetical protein